ncbi:MAG TPA: YncE family protein [Polyangiaceae bacterium]|nr:YncE family protein [Polyangiaceae bacterium]
MSPSPRLEKFLFLVATTLAVGCSGSVTDGKDAETAFPNRRPTFERAGRRLGYVANRNSDTVSVLDLDAMTLLGSVPVGRGPVDIDGPRHVVLDTANELAYIALSYPFANTSVHALSLGATQRSAYVQALNLSDLSIAGDLRVDPSAADLAFSPATGQLAVSHFDTFRALSADPNARRANLILLDRASAVAEDSAEPRRLPLCAAPASIAFNADGARVFVACTGEDSIAVVDSVSGEVLSRVPAGESAVNKPYALVVDPARDRLLVSNQVSFAVSVFDLSDTPNLLSTLSRIPGVPMFATMLSDTRLALPFQAPNGASLYDLTTGEELFEIQYPDEECMNPAEISVSGDSRVYLVCEGDHYHPGSVVELDPDTLTIKASVTVERYPERLSISEP